MASPQPSPAPLTGHRLFTITPDDHRGQVWTVSLLFGIFSLLVLGLRGSTGHGNLGADDWTAAAATVSQTFPSQSNYAYRIIRSCWDWGSSVPFSLLPRKGWAKSIAMGIDLKSVA